MYVTNMEDLHKLKKFSYLTDQKLNLSISLKFINPYFYFKLKSLNFIYDKKRALLS